MNEKNKEIMKELHKMQIKKIKESNAIMSKNLPKLNKKQKRICEEADAYVNKEYDDQCKVQAIWILRERREKIRKMEAKLFRDEGLLYQALADDLTD